MKFDIAVIGGGQPGVCAAIAAAQEGKKVVIINDRPLLGGNASSECFVPSHGAEAMSHNRNCREGGILEDMRLDYYHTFSPYSDNRAYWNLILWEYCRKEKNLTVLLHTRVYELIREVRRVTKIKVIDLATEDQYEIKADFFIDDTGDGWAAFNAGASYRFGREAKDEFGEQVFGKEKADSHTLGCSIYGFAVKRDYPVKFKKPEWAKTYNQCASLPNRPHDVHHIFPTIAASRDQRNIQFFWWLEWGGHLNVIKDIDKIYNHLLKELFGLWDHLKNSCTSETVKALENFELTSWSAFPMKRESRRIEGDYILNENDLFYPKLFEDRIGFGGWPLDDHPPEGVESVDPPCDQVFLYEPYSIPYRCCYSKDLDNLFLVGRCISVTHSALASVRVMNTLGILGEAVGVAAAMCCEYKCNSREIGVKYIGNLHQKILDRDLCLIGIKSTNPLNKAPGASVEVSSERTLEKTESIIDKFELRWDTALQIPVTSDTIESLSVFLNCSQESAEVSWEICVNKTLAVMDGHVSAFGVLELKQGDFWYDLKFAPVKTHYGDLLTIILKANPQVSWHYGEEIYQTRWGVKFIDSGDGVFYHGRSRMAPTDRKWTFINHNGRLTYLLSSWLEGKKGKKIHSKLYITPAFHIAPVQKPYGALNLTNGITRSENWPNLWLSAKGAKQQAALKWNSEETISKIEIIFDTQLDYSDQKYGFPRGEKDYTMPEIIAETVKSFVVKYLHDGTWRTCAECTDNYRRRWIKTLDPPVKTSALCISVLETWGADYAAIYEIKAF